jgi:diguanylate cyclase (GGDEF)-like protein
LLRWLVEAGPGVPMLIRSILLDEMVSSTMAALPGPLNGVLLNVVALCLNAGRIFAVLLFVEIVLLLARLAALERTRRNRRHGRATPPDLYLSVAILWCGLQGAMGCAGMASGVLAMQILSATSIMALTGPICARTYGAPRYAMLLLGLCYLPLVLGAQMIRQPWLLVMVAQTPLLFIGAGTILKRYQSLSVNALHKHAASHYSATHDSLTGLLNRLGLAEALMHQLVPREPFAMLYLDLDGFKPVNDSFGHKVGDTVLAAVGARLRELCRGSDLVARIGGDEFIVLLRDVTVSACDALAESMIHRISEPYPLGSGRTVAIGVSIGWAYFPDDSDDLDELQRKADAALYDAKAAGKGVHRRYTDLDAPAALAAAPYIIPPRPRPRPQGVRSSPASAPTSRAGCVLPISTTKVT